jgi:hypothetical protein
VEGGGSGRDNRTLDMASERTTHHWRPDDGDAAAEHPAGAAGLEQRMRGIARDRASTSRELVHEAARELADWLQGTPDVWDVSAAHRDLAAGLGELEATHAWRGPVALWLETLRATLALCEREGSCVRSTLAEELGLWLGGESGDDAGLEWSGAPLDAGVRLAPRAACTAALLADLGPREIIVVHGYSETVALALEEAGERGLAPHAVLSECAPDLGGRRMAQRLQPKGLQMTLIFDSALHMAAHRADRVWVGCEAIGAQAFLARRGTRGLLEEARRSEVSTAVVATSDKLMPRGELSLPTYCAGETWTLWEDAPEGVSVDAQAFEEVQHGLADAFFTEAGRESAAALCLRSLNTTDPGGWDTPPGPLAGERAYASRP